MCYYYCIISYKLTPASLFFTSFHSIFPVTHFLQPPHGFPISLPSKFIFLQSFSLIVPSFWKVHPLDNPMTGQFSLLRFKFKDKLFKNSSPDHATLPSSHLLSSHLFQSLFFPSWKRPLHEISSFTYLFTVKNVFPAPLKYKVSFIFVFTMSRRICRMKQMIVKNISNVWGLRHTWNLVEFPHSPS